MNKQLISLSVLIAILATAIYYLVVQSNAQQQQSELFIPGLSASANDIERISITTASGELLRAIATDKGWISRVDGVTEDYPVDQQKLSILIKELSEVLLLEAKTKRPQNFAILGLTDLSDPDSQATLIDISTSKDAYQVLIGSAASSGQGSYARRIDQKQSWLLNRIISVPSDSFDWLRQPILDISKQQVIAITRTDVHPFEIRNNAPQKAGFSLQNMSPKQSLKYDSIVEGFVDSLVNLDFDSIVDPNKSVLPVDAKTVSYEISIQNGDVIQMQMWHGEQISWVRFEQMTGSEKPYWHGITYQIANFSAGQLNKQASDFVETKSDTKPLPINTQSIEEGESPSSG